MSSLQLDHVTLTTSRLDETVSFYFDVLRLRSGPRPPLEANGVKVPGAWLYPDGGGYPILHIIGRQPKDRSTGAFDHVAFRRAGLLPFLDHLRAKAIDFTAKPVPDTPDTQVHFLDPNGVKIEVIFAERVDQRLLSGPACGRTAAADQAPPRRTVAEMVERKRD